MLTAIRESDIPAVLPSGNICSFVTVFLNLLTIDLMMKLTKR